MKKITLENGKTIEISDEKYAELVPKNNKNWRAEKGETYNCIDSYGVIDFNYEDNTEKDTYRYNTLNYFRTEEEAEKARERQLAIGIVTRKINELNGDWEADLGGKGQRKYFIYFDIDDKKFRIDWSLFVGYKSILPYISSPEIADKILSENGKELSIIWEL